MLVDFEHGRQTAVAFDDVTSVCVQVVYKTQAKCYHYRVAKSPKTLTLWHAFKTERCDFFGWLSPLSEDFSLETVSRKIASQIGEQQTLFPVNTKSDPKSWWVRVGFTRIDNSYEQLFWSRWNWQNISDIEFHNIAINRKLWHRPLGDLATYIFYLFIYYLLKLSESTIQIV